MNNTLKVDENHLILYILVMMITGKKCMRMVPIMR